ncbi:hypothetical protein AHMF7605_12030 [Adhaeribacter arboris]|uniref:Peptidase S24/S26A/S26B/S26C domain-containing protein n=1 Tax=Adhaeribacter arboris TaxID=2072846 RepID=A0A2T2YFA7_9BACT|nr:S24 family peptidase [Adhaeribacter arboris]PSR54199.1 hypothetical protein AHMF7605_12030 [Adhaeribacter arboris]
MKERIKELIKALSEEKIDFFSLIGISKDTVRMYTDRGSKPKSDFMEKVYRSIENLNPEWWLTGQGEMFIKSNKTIIKSEEPKSFLNQNSAVPIYDIEVRAGIVSRLIENNENIPIIGWYYLKDIPNIDGIIGVRAVGDSMVPFITGGDTLLIKRVDKNGYIAPGLSYVIITSNMTVVKYIQKGPNKNYWHLKSHNSDKEQYPDDEIAKDEIIHLFLVVKVLKELTY